MVLEVQSRVGAVATMGTTIVVNPVEVTVDKSRKTYSLLPSLTFLSGYHLQNYWRLGRRQLRRHLHRSRSRDRDHQHDGH